MHHYLQNLTTGLGKSSTGTHTVFNVGGPGHQSLETTFNNIMSPLQTPPASSATSRAWTSFHQPADPPIGFCSDEFLDHSPLPCHKSSGDHSTVSSIQYHSTSPFSFTNSLHSIVESFLSSSCEEESLSDSLYAQSQQNELPAAEDVKPLQISFQRNPQSDKQRSRACRSSLTRKRRIRWTKDLHEPFVTIVNCLGGPHKAKPKTILQMMDSDVLTISHIKSHLQKYRSSTCDRKDLQEERSGEGNQPEGVSEIQLKIHKQIEESLQLQREVQRSIHEQQEIQRNLQQLIKQHWKQLKIMSDPQNNWLEGRRVKKGQ
ncbi:hypothetical protein QN277_021115 [Acacia crassicarpa]|uniref:Uncharacterized protein n=1 Tax=Acacia crassicarpa TaxID=499986 RepID=A0AAE1JR28_9FABA|nr:hypothetical protein QN277_021115 [Acacia crassicarpa]